MLLFINNKFYKHYLATINNLTIIICLDINKISWINLNIFLKTKHVTEEFQEYFSNCAEAKRKKYGFTIPRYFDSKYSKSNT
jgi:hypothetical protein